MWTFSRRDAQGPLFDFLFHSPSFSSSFLLSFMLTLLHLCSFQTFPSLSFFLLPSHRSVYFLLSLTRPPSLLFQFLLSSILFPCFYYSSSSSLFHLFSLFLFPSFLYLSFVLQILSSYLECIHFTPLQHTSLV